VNNFINNSDFIAAKFLSVRSDRIQPVDSSALLTISRGRLAIFVAAHLDFSARESAESISLLQLQWHSGSGTSSAVVNLTDSML
jgi:hypothetical protein